MNDQDLTQARTAVESILSALDVGRVVYVDDANGDNISLEEVIAAAAGLDEPQLLAAFPELGEAIPDDPDVLKQKMRDVWGQLDKDIQTERGSAVIIADRRQDSKNTDDVADAAILSDLIQNDRLFSLSPEQWEAQQEQLLNDSKQQRTLFLFDQDFSDTGGDAEGGIKIIESLLSKDDSGRLICGLITHHINPETQLEQWDELSKSHNIPKDRFVVIPKRHLNEAPILFAQMLKFAALSPDFAEMKRKTKEIISTAATTAADRVEDVSIYDLDHIVFRVSAEEGLWEPDMLFRLHALFHRLKARQLAHEDGSLETIAAKLRAVSEIPTHCDLFPPPSSAWALQRKELYEPDDHINKNYLPLELGDIFERVGADSSKRYILLAQPCDLMIRGDGKRHPEMHRVPLAEVVAATEEPQYSEEMPYFDESATQRWYVKLKLIHFVRVCILDLCVFNQDGIARCIVNGKAPSDIRPAWKVHHKFLSRHINRLVNKADLLAHAPKDSKKITQFKEELTRDIGGLFFDDDLFKGSLSEAGGIRTVTYDCKRVGRLSRARAIGFLMSYTATVGRAAYDRDFGKS